MKLSIDKNRVGYETTRYTWQEHPEQRGEYDIPIDVTYSEIGYNDGCIVTRLEAASYAPDNWQEEPEPIVPISRLARIPRVEDMPEDTTAPDEQPGTDAPEPQQQRSTLPDIVPDSVWLTAFTLCTKEELPGIPWQDREEIRQELAAHLTEIASRQMAQGKPVSINWHFARTDRDRIVRRVCSSETRLILSPDVAYPTAEDQQRALEEIDQRRTIAQGDAWRAHLNALQAEKEQSQRLVGVRLL